MFLVVGSGFTGRKSMRIARMGPVLSGDAKYGLKCSGLLFNFQCLNMFLQKKCDGNFRLTESAGMLLSLPVYPWSLLDPPQTHRERPRSHNWA